MATTSAREGAPLAPQDDEAAEEPLLAHERDGEKRVRALPDVQVPGLWSDTSCESFSMSATWTGSRITPARPTAPSPSRTGAVLSTVSCSGVTWWVARAWKLWEPSSNS